jgi:hypothetical protein
MARKPEIEQYTAEELAAAGLTEGEMSALQDEGDSGEEPTRAGDEDEGHHSLADRSDDRSMPHAEEAATEPEALAPDATAKTEAAPAQQPPADIEPPVERDRMPQLQAPELKDWSALRADLSKRYEEGEITNAQFTNELSDLVKQETTAELRVSFNQEMAAQRWQEQQDNFMAANRNYATNPIAYQALNAAVNAVSLDPVNAKLTGDQILQKAHEQVMEAFGMPAAKTQAKQPEATPARKTPDLRQVPKTLAHLPMAAAEDMGNDRFSEIDKLDGLDQERAIARLSDADRDQYLRDGTIG